MTHTNEKQCCHFCDVKNYLSKDKIGYCAHSRCPCHKDKGESEPAIVNFQCSNHEDPIPTCLLCSLEQYNQGRADTIAEIAEKLRMTDCNCGAVVIKLVNELRKGEA